MIHSNITSLRRPGPPRGDLAQFARLVALVLGLLVLVGPASAATRYIVGSSPALPPATREAAYAQLTNLALKDLKPGERLQLFDALNQREIASLAMPADAALTSTVAGRLRSLGGGLQQIRAFFAGMPVGSGDGAINEPKFLATVGDQIRAPGEDLRVVILGSPIYKDDRQPEFGFDGGYFPSDAFLGADDSLSPFSVRGHAKRLDGVPVYQANLGGCYASNAHEAGVSHFWNLFVNQQGGSLAAYASDPAVVFDRLRQGVRVAATTETIDATQTKPQMLRRFNNTAKADLHDPVPPAAPDWMSREHVDQAAPLTEPVVQALKIGVRWSVDCDVDIYASSQGNPDLYFGRNRTAEGHHLHDFVKPPAGGNTFETIEFDKPVDIRNIRAAVNLYSGHAPNRQGIPVEVRVWAGEGKIFSRALTIPAVEGNCGANSAGRAHDSHWVVLDLANICGLH